MVNSYGMLCNMDPPLFPSDGKERKKSNLDLGRKSKQRCNSEYRELFYVVKEPCQILRVIRETSSLELIYMAHSMPK